MNKKYTICLSCGQVQIRTDINKEIKNKYIVLNKKMCPNCGLNTKQVATKNIKLLKKELNINRLNSLDEQLYYLIQR